MSVYIHEPLLDGKRLYSRITADTVDELLECIELLGLQEEWIRDRDTPGFHLQVYGTKLFLALNFPKIQYLSLSQYEDTLTLKSDK